VERGDEIEREGEKEIEREEKLVLAWSKKGHGNGILSDFWSVALGKIRQEFVIIKIILF